MISKETEMEINKLNNSLKEFEIYFQKSLENMENQMFKMITNFKNIRDEIKSECENLRNKENSKMNMSLNKSISFNEEPTQFVTPEHSINVRYPKYVSPSLKNTPNCTNTSINSLKNINNVPDIFQIKIIQSFSRGMLSRLIFSSKIVNSLKDTVKESKKILESMDNEKKSIPQNFNQKDFKDRFLIEINMAKAKIHSIFFEYTYSQQFSLIHQNSKHKATPISETKMNKMSKKTPDSLNKSFGSSRKTVSPSIPTFNSRRN